MNFTKSLLAFLLVFNITVPTQARTRSMAQVLTAAKNGLHACLTHPIIWGRTKALTPATLFTALATGAVVSYLFTRGYEQESEDKVFRADDKSETQESRANFCIGLTTTGIGAATGALVGNFSNHSTSKCALYGAIAGLGALIVAELYSHRSEKSFIRYLRTIQLPESMRSRYLHEVGDICTSLTFLGLGAAAGTGSNWLLTDNPDIKRSAVAGLIGGLIGIKAYELRN